MYFFNIHSEFSFQRIDKGDISSLGAVASLINKNLHDEINNGDLIIMDDPVVWSHTASELKTEEAAEWCKTVIDIAQDKGCKVLMCTSRYPYTSEEGDLIGILQRMSKFDLLNFSANPSYESVEKVKDISISIHQGQYMQQPPKPPQNHI